MKKVMQIVVALVVSLGFMGSVNAAVNQKLINYAKSKNVSSSDMVRIEKFLQNNNVDDTKADQIIAKANAAEAILKEAQAKNSSIKSYDQLSSSDKQRVFKLAQEAGNLVGANITYNGANKILIIEDTNGIKYDVPVPSAHGLVQADGSNLVSVASVSGVAVVLLAAAVIGRKKRNA